jgi:hypothetical protein
MMKVGLFRRGRTEWMDLEEEENCFKKKVQSTPSGTPTSDLHRLWLCAARR